jgi:hypothetical protein
MDNYTIIKASRDEKGIITHLSANGNSSPEGHQYVTVRGGLCWPNQGAPAYYVILGQIYGGPSRFTTGTHQKKPLRVLSEFASGNLREFFDRLAKDTALFLCQGYFTDTSDLWKGYEASLSDYCRGNQIAVHPSLHEAIFVENFQYGANLIKEWLADDALLAPQPSVLYSQLSDGGMQESNFGDADIVVRFYAINALRYVVTAFSYHNFGPSKSSRKRRRDARVI